MLIYAPLMINQLVKGNSARADVEQSASRDFFPVARIISRLTARCLAVEWVGAGCAAATTNDLCEE